MIYDISVIIPIYNSEKFLDATMLSVINQDMFNKLEIILINDGSIDNSLKICEKYKSKYSNIKVYSQNNSGVSTARNVGIKKSTGKYVTFLDSDDEIDNNLYSNIFSAIEKSQSDIFIFDFDKVHIDGSIVKYRGEIKKEWITSESAMLDFFSGIIGNQVVDKIFKREVIKEIEFPCNYKIGEDMYFMYLAIKNSNFITMDSSICGYHYIVRENSAMTSNFNSSFFDCVKLSEKILRDYECNKNVLPYAKAHLVHEICKSLEYIYKNNAQSFCKLEVEKMERYIKKYKVKNAKKYLTNRQFFGFVLMKYCPSFYLSVHKMMKIG